MVRYGCRIGLALGITAALSATAMGDVPRLVSYQGKVEGAGAGPVNLRIAFYDAEVGGNVLFSEGHDPVALHNEVFSILLGSNTIGGIDDSAFDAAEVWLETTVDAVTLSPRTRIVMVPYAAKATSAERLVQPDTFDIVALTDTSGVLSVVNGLGDPRVNLDGDRGGGGAVDVTNELGDLTIEIRGRDSLGTGGCVRLFNDAGLRTFEIDSEGGGGAAFLELAESSGLTRLRLNGDLTTGDGARLQMFAVTNQETVSLLADEGGNGASLTMNNELGGTAVKLDADDGTGARFMLHNRSGIETIDLNADGGGLGGGETPGLALTHGDGSNRNSVRLQVQRFDGGRIGVRNDAAVETIDIDGDENTGGGAIDLRNDAGDETLQLRGRDAFGTGGCVQGFNDAGNITFDLDSGATGFINVHDGTGSTTTNTVQIRSTSGSGGEVRLLNALGVTGLTLDGSNANGGELVARNANSFVTAEVTGQGSASGGEIILGTGNGTDTVTIKAAETNTQGAEIQLRDATGVTTIEIDADFNGEGRVRTQVLEITGGSDLSEQFDIRGDGTPIEPGMLVCIDPDNIGKLIISSRPYDNTVAGIVSGAGGIKPGMLMGQRDSIADGAIAVALTGRVWAKCDASHAPIQPGDLLTTSGRPGMAMRASDGQRSQGAVIGKAMSPLSDGQGLVLVLVQPQ